MPVTLVVTGLLTCLGGVAQAKKVPPPPARQSVDIRDGLPDDWPALSAPGSTDICSNLGCGLRSEATGQRPLWLPLTMCFSKTGAEEDR